MSQLKRAHSADPDAKSATPEDTPKPTPSDPSVDTSLTPSQQASTRSLSNQSGLSDVPPEALVGSPLKKARPSIDQTNSSEKYSATQSLSAALGSVMGGSPGATPAPLQPSSAKVEEEEEEL